MEKEELQELHNAMVEIYSIMFDEKANFILKYLEGKRKKVAKFDGFVLRINRCNFSIKTLIDETLKLSESGYIQILSRKDFSIKIKLTEEGLSVAKYIQFDRHIIQSNFFYRCLFYGILATMQGLKAILRAIKAIFSRKTATIIMYVLSVIAGIYGAIQLYEWLVAKQFIPNFLGF